MVDSTLDHRHQLAEKFGGALCVLIIIGTGVRGWIVGYHVVTLIGVMNILLSLLLYRFIRANRHPTLEAPLLVAMSFYTIIPLLLITGGINSQLASLLVCYPILAALLGDRRLPLVTTCIVLVLIVTLLVFNDTIMDITGSIEAGSKTMARGIWLSVGVFIMFYIDIFFQKTYIALTNRLAELATLDHLTGILNRRGLEIRLDEELQRQQRSDAELSLLMIDVDNFKQFNDSYGHAAGDACLKELAACLQKNTRASDLRARFGGEEFLVVLIDADADQAARVAEKLRKCAAGIALPGVQEPVSITIGYVCSNAATAMGREELIRKADRALYKGKENGRNQVVSADLTERSARA
jgi:diguanylate cyclase (GGDEF)-like protein